ncbi:MAG: BPTD_3080 family restriction endonuclease [bacterium]
MSTDLDKFFERPILNSPYECPTQHWELDEDRQPTNKILETRRPADFITPIPAPRQVRRANQTNLPADEDDGLLAQQEYATTIINEVRGAVDAWRKFPNPNDWGVTPTTTKLLEHWRGHRFSNLRPFFCQIEAVEIAIWLTEVAPKFGENGDKFIKYLANANQESNPDLSRLALKLATGAGKTTVMAMLIAWQTLNAVRNPNNKSFTKGFLVVTPGITIRDRLRVLKPNDPDSYLVSRELVPSGMLRELHEARIVITNYHAFKLRETIKLAKGSRQLLQGQRGEEIKTLETEGQMLKRVMPELEKMKNIMVLNDEAHHCYREKLADRTERKLVEDEKTEAKKNTDAARVWITGLETVQRKLKTSRVFDLSATPFFLRGSGYAEGTLFPWTMSDFSLMDAIESGIVKLPRVPVSDNVPDEDIPKFRNLWTHIREHMPRKGRRTGGALDPLSLPTELQGALEALYGHYEKVYQQWQEVGIKVPPCFVLVCNNTATSKLLYDYISGFHSTNEDGSVKFNNGRLKLFRNFDDEGKPLPRPRTLLIDSEQLESGEALDKNFRAAASAEIEHFRSDVRKRGDHKLAENLSDEDLLREVMNTVGKEDRLGGETRCVVSVSMLTEGWDANTVTHILGVRAFGTQLLCEQVVGRALRRLSYKPNDDGLLSVEYADVFGIPFDFTARPGGGSHSPPENTIHVQAISPDRDASEITFPRVAGYRVDLPEDHIKTKFDKDSTYKLTPKTVAPTKTRNEGIIGEGVNLSLDYLEKVRLAEVAFYLTRHLVEKKWRKPNEAPRAHLFGQLLRITQYWLEHHLICQGGTKPAQLLYLQLADAACERITRGIVTHFENERPVKATLDAYNPIGSTRYVNFRTSKSHYRTDPRRCHINYVVCDSSWESEFCRIVESHPRVRAYVKNQNLGLEVPYRYRSISRKYFPDFIVRLDDGNGEDDLLNLIVEIKGYRGEDAEEKKSTMDAYWVPGVNNLKEHGRWAFAEFTEVFEMEDDFEAKITEQIEQAIAAETNTHEQEN